MYLYSSPGGNDVVESPPLAMIGDQIGSCMRYLVLHGPSKPRTLTGVPSANESDETPGAAGFQKMECLEKYFQGLNMIKQS